MLDKTITGLTDEQESILEKNIVWLFGSPRGGTSWVALQLLSYNTNSINEPHIDEHLAIRAPEIHERFVRRIDNPQKSSEYFFSDKYKGIWNFYLRKLLLNRFYVQSHDLSRQTIVKEVCQFGSADIITECLPNSKMIILLRDGRDQIDSLLNARSKKGWMTKKGLQPITSTGVKQNYEGFQPPPPRNVFIKNHSKSWVIRYENFLKAYNNHSAKLHYKVKYEDLLKNTYDELKKLYNFLQIDITDEKLNDLISKYSFEKIPEDKKGDGKFARSATPGEWRENFTEKEKKIMNETMGEMLNKLGYDKD